MRLIDADALKEKINTTFWSEIGAIIDNAPTIEHNKSAEQNVADVPIDDLVSRKTLIGAIEKCGEDKIYPQALIETIKALPSADRPQVKSNSAEEQIAETCDRPKGEWINDGLESFGIRKAYICSCCGYSTRYYKDFNNTTNYCPNCGADMRPEK